MHSNKVPEPRHGCDRSPCVAACQRSQLSNRGQSRHKSMADFLTDWTKAVFWFGVGYLMSQSSLASLALANVSLIDLTESSLFVVSASEHFGVETGQIILLSFECETEEQFPLAAVLQTQTNSTCVYAVCLALWGFASTQPLKCCASHHARKPPCSIRCSCRRGWEHHVTTSQIITVQSDKASAAFK